jgi:hypothetical protein
MKRACAVFALIAAAAVASPVLRADVKTTEKSTFRFEGIMGAMINRMVGGGDGATTAVAVKGTRMSRMTPTAGQIVDLAEEKVYSVDVRRKEYTVMTFAQMREQMEKLKADLAKQQQQMSAEDKQALQDAGKQFEFDVDVKETGQTKPLAGQNTREVVVTIAMRQAGRKLEESGGLVVTSNVWLAPRLAAMDELHEFNLKFVKALYGGMFSGVNPQQMTALSSLLPGLAPLMERMTAESRKLAGTPLSTVTVFESVKSAEQMKAAPEAGRGGGGLGGMLARRLGRGQSEQRTKALTITNDVLSVAPAATADDVAVPAGFKLKT